MLSDLRTDYLVEGSHKKILSVSSIIEAGENDLSFCYYEGEKGLTLVSNSKAGIIICKRSLYGLIHPKPGKQQFFFLDNPRLVFIQIYNRLYKKKMIIGISSDAQISKSAKIGNNCYIGDFTVIGDKCVIGDNTVIYDRVSLQNCRLVTNCIIQPGVTVGADGFGFERYPNFEIIRFPHIGRVQIEDNVEISSNTSISRGSLSDTIIGKSK